MNPKLYYDNFLIGDRENKLFCFLPFQKENLSIFNNIVKPSAESVDLGCEIANDEKSGKEIMDRIYEGINKSRFLLFDLSHDKRYGDKINANVAYELGVARSIRYDTDILLITNIKSIDKDIPFNIKGMNIIKTKDLTKDKFFKILKSAQEKQLYYQDKRLETVCNLVDGESLVLMYNYGRMPDGYNHFGSLNMPAELKMSALRLLDLAILKTAIVGYKKGYEYAYYWTPFGKAIMKNLGINKLSVEEFKQLPNYQEFLKADEVWREFKKNVTQ